MAHKKFDGVQQLATGLGSGVLTLGSVTSAMYRTMQSAGMTDGDTMYVRIQHETIPAEWEDVLVTYSAGAITPSYDAKSTSATGTLIAFSVGNKIVSSAILAEQVITADNNDIAAHPLGWTVAAGSISFTKELTTLGGSNIHGLDRLIPIDSSDAVNGDYRDRRTQINYTGSVGAQRVYTNYEGHNYNHTAGTVALAYVDHNFIGIHDAGNVDVMAAYFGHTWIDGSGSAINSHCFVGGPPTLITGTGAITNSHAFFSSDQGHATRVTNAFGFRGENFTQSLGDAVTFASHMQADARKYAIKTYGTAQSNISGKLSVGTTVDPTHTLQVQAEVAGALTSSVLNTDAGVSSSAEFILSAGGRGVGHSVARNTQSYAVGGNLIVSYTRDFDTHKFRTNAGVDLLTIDGTAATFAVPIVGGPGEDSATTFLGADVPLNNTANFFDGPNTGSIGAAGEKWLITANATMSDTAGAAVFGLAIHDGTNYIVGNNGSIHAANFPVNVSVSIVVTLAAATAFALRARDASSTSGVLQTTSTGGAIANKATSITAVRLS